jgi:hypothetical protein
VLETTVRWLEFTIDRGKKVWTRLLLPIIQSLQRHNVGFAVGKIFVEATNICKVRF